MAAYRVEVAPNSRAGCNDALCKKNGVKIKKGEIRFGVWVEGVGQGGHEFQSFRYRHWGCVSGKTLQNIRELLIGPLADEGEYKWDLLDGLEEMPLDYQEKIKLAITEGKIADEDWNGDPEYNVLGKTGIRGRMTSKKKNLESEEGAENAEVPETPVKHATKKRGRVQDDDGYEETRPAKKRSAKAKKEATEEDELQLLSKSKVRKAAKIEGDDEDVSKPVKKPRVRKGARDETDEAESLTKDSDFNVDPNLAKRAKAKKGAGKKDILIAEGNTDENGLIYPKKSSARKARSKKVMKEESADDGEVKLERNDDVNLDVRPVKISRSKKAIKEEEADEGDDESKENDGNARDVKPMTKHENGKIVNDVKNEYGEVNAGKSTTLATTVKNMGGIQDAEIPEDHLERIEMGFCDINRPLVRDFNEMVKTKEVRDNDWSGFLKKKFEDMVNISQVADGDFKGFLQKMHERETAAGESVPTVPEKSKKGKKTSTTVTKPRIRRGKAS